MEYLYRVWAGGPGRYADTCLTDILLAAGVDPLRGLSYIPECFMIESSEISAFEIPDHITSIHSGAFIKAPSLREITIGRNVSQIFEDAFVWCRNINLIINRSQHITDLHKRDFAQYATIVSDAETLFTDGDFTFAKVGNTYRLALYRGSGSKTALPSTAAGHQYEIATGALSGISEVSNLVGVSKICRGAFDSSISRVDIDSLDTWASITFENPTANPLYFNASLWVGGRELTDLTDWKRRVIPSSSFVSWKAPELIIPEGVDTIESQAFYMVQGDTLVLPTSLKSVAGDAFYGSRFNRIVNNSGLLIIPHQPSGANSCGGATWQVSEVVNQGKAPVYSTSNYQVAPGSGAALVYSLGTQSAADLSLPEDIKGKPIELPVGAFRQAGLQKLHLPDSLKFIPVDCFRDNPKLAEIWWGANIQEVSAGGFQSTHPQCKVYLEDLESWCNTRWRDESANPGRYLYLKSSPLVDLHVPNSVVELPYRAFARCQSLQKVSIPEGCIAIGQSAFSICLNLTSVSLPSSLQTLASSCFSKNIALTEINYAGTKEMWRGVRKEANWRKGSSIEAVHCSDGDIAL